MSKRVVVNPDGTVKKKRSCCCSCFLAVFIIALVVLVGGTVVGCVFLNKYTEEKFDMSLKECFGVVTSLYGAKDKDIVDNGYTEADADGFDNELKKQLFLKESAELDVVSAVKEAITMATETEAETAPLSQAVRLYSETGQTDEQPEPAEKTGSDKLLDFLTGLVDPDGVDYDRLQAYDDALYAEYCFTMKDRELAAFLSKVLQALATENADLSEMLDQVGASRLDQVAELRQIKFAVEQHTYITDSGVRSTDVKDVAVANVTLQVKLAEVLKTASRKYINSGFLAGLAAFGGKAVLPNNLYITVGIGLSDNIGVHVYINRINNERKLDSTYKLIRGIAELSGSDFDLETWLDELATEKINPVVGKLDGTADYSQMNDHALVVDTYGAIANLVDKSETDRLTGRQLLKTVSSLTTSDPYGAVLPEHSYDIWYEKDGIRYTADDPARPQDATKVDYQLAFMKELDDKYLIDVFVRDGDGTPDYTTVAPGRSFSELVKAFGMDGGSTDLMNLINMNRFARLSEEGVTAEQLKITLTDKMLGAIIAENLATLGADAIQSSGLQLKVVQLAVLTRTVDDVTTDFVEISVEVDVSSLFEGLGGLGSFVGMYLPEHIVMTVSVDSTLDRPAEERLPAGIRYNSMTADETAEMLKVMEKFGVSGFDPESVTAMVAQPVNQILDNMRKALIIEIAPSKLTAEKNDPANDPAAYPDVSADPANSDIVLPSLYHILETNVFTRVDPETGEREFVAAERIKAVFDALYTYVNGSEGLLDAGSPVADNYAAVQKELHDKYFVKTHYTVDSFDTLVYLLDINNPDVERFDLDAFYAAGEDAGHGQPLLSSAELGRIFAEKLDNVDGRQADFTVLRVQTTPATGNESAKLKALIEIDMSRAIGQNTNLMPVSKMYVTVTVDIGSTVALPDGRTAYATEFVVNDMSEAEQTDLFTMIGMVAGEDVVDMDTITADIGATLYEEFLALNDAVNRNTTERVEAFTVTDKGLVLLSFADYLNAYRPHA